MEKYGFVYIWFDRKHKRYYIGCHWGKEDDGYICSSSNMLSAYKRRPADFKRRLLTKIYSNRKDLLQEEYIWLSKIKQEELGVRYYNIQNRHFSHWSTNETSSMTIGEKISRSQKNNPDFGKWNKGKTRSEKTKKKISESTSKSMKIHYKNNPRTENTKLLISSNCKRLQKEKKIGMHGKKHKVETLEKMKANNAMNNPEHIAKVKASKQGIRWLTDGKVKKMAVPGSTKYIALINQGFNLL